MIPVTSTGPLGPPIAAEIEVSVSAAVAGYPLWGDPCEL